MDEWGDGWICFIPEKYQRIDQSNEGKELIKPGAAEAHFRIGIECRCNWDVFFLIPVTGFPRTLETWKNT